MVGWTDEAREASAEARRAKGESGETQRFHLTFNYVNPEYGHNSTGNQVVHHENLEGAAQQIMRERNIPSITIGSRLHQNGQVDAINKQFTNAAYKAPPPPAPRRVGRSRRSAAYSR